MLANCIVYYHNAYIMHKFLFVCVLMFISVNHIQQLRRNLKTNLASYCRIQLISITITIDRLTVGI